ncbi:MAG: DNA repair protein RecO [Clostridia bacterium]|nr:DNA repair protein RecO [Clostridia bacterium]
MEPIKTTGIVVHSTTVGDYNKMLTVLSADFGRISVWAKGAKSQKHDAHSSMALLSYSEFVLLPKGDVYTLSSATLKESFYGLRNSLEELAYAMYFASFADTVAPQGMEAGEILRLLLNSLYFLEKNLKEKEDLRLMFELFALTVEGYAPTFDACSECGNEAALWFDVQSGGVVCDSCRTQSSRKISDAARQLMNFYTSSSLKDALYFKADPDAVREGTKLCEEFIKIHIGHISALDYLKSVI